MQSLDELLNNKNFTLALIALVLYLAFLYCKDMNKTNMVHEAFGNVPLNLLDQSYVSMPYGNNCSGYQSYNNPIYKQSDEANMKLQQQRGLATRSYLDRGDVQFTNYMNMDKNKLTRPYTDEYKMTPSYFPQPIKMDNDCPCAK